MDVEDHAGDSPPHTLGLAEILHPVTVAELLRDYWGKKPLHIEASRRDRFATLFDLDRFRRAVIDDRVVKLRGSLDSGASYFSARGGDIDTLLKSGATLCADHLEEADPGLGACVERVARELRYPGKIDFRCYLSPDGAGFDTHFDQRIATVLQIAGQKRWRFSPRPAVDYPEYQAVPDGKGGVEHGRTLNPDVLAVSDFTPPDDAGFLEVVLRPGDLLCLPAGTWHKAKAVGWSLALNLAFAPVRVHEIVWATVRKRLDTDPVWRQGIVPVPAEGGEPGGSEPTLRDYIRRLRNVLDELERADAAT
jgi:ribosomal protein L16 Arg81 hydroxylase